MVLNRSVRVSNTILRAGVASVGLATSLQVFAGPPVSYDGWTVGAGTINGTAYANGVIDTTASCSVSGITCTNFAEEQGFLLQEVNNGTRTFFRIIMTDSDASGNPQLTGSSANLSYASETFTPFAFTGDPLCQGAAAQDCQGLAEKLIVRDLNLGFESQSLIQRNFAKSNEALLDDMFNVDFQQTLTSTDPATGLDVSDAFSYRSWTHWECTDVNCGNNTVVGYEQELSQSVETAATTKQELVQVSSGGYKGRQAGFFMSTPVRTAGGDMTLEGDTVFWNDTDEIRTMWFASDTSGNLVSQTVENISTGASAAEQQFGASSLDPIDWDVTAFGTPPTF